MLHRFVFVYLFIHVLVISAVSFAESDPSASGVQTLDPVVVSATKTPIPLRQVTSAVEIWTEEDLQRRQIKTVVEALRLTQGTAVLQNGGPGGTTNVRIRGGSSEQTLVLIDGAIMNSATLGSFNFAHLTTDNIEKIEIVRGAQSTLWGADAMGGVINITTKRGGGPLRAGGFFEYGSFSTLREGGNLSGSKGPVDYSFALSRWDTTGISQINDRRGATERDAYRNWQGSARIGMALPRDGRLDFNFRWWNGSLNIDSSSGPSDVLNAKSNSRQFTYGGTYQQPLTDWWNHSLTLSRSQEASLFDPGTLQRNLTTGMTRTPFGDPNETRVLANRIESQHNFRVNQYVTLTAGYQFREQLGENDAGISEKIVSSHAGFGQMQLNLFDRLFATAGVRHDAYNAFGDATTYRITGGYLVKETNTKIRGSYATGFRAPAINELYWPGFGNPDLQPEENQSFDVGVDQALFADRVTLSGGYFWNRYRDLIQTIQSEPLCGTGSFGANFCPVNVASASTQGWEGMVDIVVAQEQPWAKRLELKGQYTMTLTRDLMSGARLRRWPVNQASLRLFYQPMDSVNTILDFRFVGKQYNGAGNTQPVGSFEVVNLAVNYDLSDRLQAYVRVDNLFDEEYEEILYYGTPGRSVFGGIRANFDLPFGR
ncbi:MAG: TonB-dependent receptor [Nitrospira sp.]|nr:TonB-dependent receptor [Nitrospira sp.]MDE0403782.1 TonB-dependent receptor [Nitrospira sp.]MDE0486462.1 TonB-dependent receptor [Nitrospira sp.]